MAPHIYNSPAPVPRIPTDRSISQFLLEINPDNVFDDKVILEDFDDKRKTFTYGGIRRAAAQGAAGLKRVLDLKPGDSILIFALNSLDWILAEHAIMWAGGVSASCNPAATPHELVHYISVAEPKYVLVDAALASKVHEALSLAKYPAGTVPGIIGLSTAVDGSSFVFPRDFMSDEAIPPLDLTNLDNRKVPAAQIFSSGTSGRPKGVLLSHHNLIAHISASRANDPAIYNSSQNEVFFAPFCHLYGLLGCICMAPFIGHYLLIMRSFDFITYMRECARIRATKLQLVPPMAVAMTKDPRIAQLDLSNVGTILCAAAPLQQEVVQALTRMLKGVNITQGYGMSEGSACMLRGNVSALKAGSVGKPLPGQSIRIVDDDLNDVSVGATGEILLRGPTVFMGYKNNPSETAEAMLEGGWLRTGDIGRVDTDGFFWLTDRKKELIKYKGNQVPPAELEDNLLSHPAVADAACCGVWDETQQTELPRAYVKLAPTVSTNAAERERVLKDIRAHVDGRVAAYKRLRGGVLELDVIPKNPTGKLLRRLLPPRLEMEERRERERREKEMARGAKL